MALAGNKQITGSFGQLFLDGTLMADVSSIEAKSTINRETVQMAGSLDEDSKITSISSEGSFVVKKVYSREIDFINAFKEGRDKRFSLYVVLDDPDAFGRESTRIDNCWLNEVTVAQFELGAVLEREFPFGYTLGSVEQQESIPNQ